MSFQNKEFEAFVSWVTPQLVAQVGAHAERWSKYIRPLGGDAGFRLYFEFDALMCGEQAAWYLGVYAPPESEKNTEFVAVAQLLQGCGVRVPKIYSVDLEKGYFLLERLGYDTYLDKLNSENANHLYANALSQLLALQHAVVAEEDYPVYDRAFLRREMQLFSTWFVSEMLSRPLQSQELALLDKTFKQLEDSALAQTQVLVHRDFHSRNIMLRPDGGAGVIDFQDAVLGPFTYDVVSLLRDCYIEWPDERVEAWALSYANEARQAGIISSITEKGFLQAFDFMGLQRHIKVLGIFARLSIRDNKNRYLADLPLVVKYVRRISKKYRALEDFNAWFEKEIMPLVWQQPWMSAGEELQR